MRWRRKEAESIDHRISQRATNRDTRLIYICESWISLFIDSPVFSHLQFIPEKKKKKKKEKISPLRVSTNSTRGIQLRQPLTRDFSSFTIASALSSGWDHQWTRYPLQETFFKERCAFSRKWHAAQVSSLLEAVFNRSPWNYAAYNAYTVSANFEAFLPLLPPSRRRRRFVKAQQILLVFHFRSMEKISSRDNYYRYYSDNHRSIAISFDANSIVHTVYIHDRSVKLRSGGF